MGTSMPADFWDRVARIVAEFIVNRNEAAGQAAMLYEDQIKAAKAQQAMKTAWNDYAKSSNWGPDAQSGVDANRG